MERKYTIYRITGLNGKSYTGYTSMTLNERWRHHRNRAKNGEAPNHPFYNAIREYGADYFVLEKLAVVYDRLSAMELEKKYIAEVPKDMSYNLSVGGVDDASEGGRIFWERLNADPKAREEYLKKLSDAKKNADWTDYEQLIKASLQWRKENPKEA
ncbi:MAG: GIY-YIG nuclease family protein, partial [Firmicutes bacterium]|nr:GIY-YIG nuclease family protein [Bacillota bacterium]